ncbi:MAG TPA: hypothetical protein GX511_03715 [Firmicutes bacterium]|nr:hypothetical protein [Bacillota bacterium]
MKWPGRATKAAVVVLLVLVLVLFSAAAALAAEQRGSVGRDVLVPQGTVSEEAVAFGGSVRVEGNVQRSAVAIGGDVYVSGSVGQDAVAIGGTVVLAPGAVVHGNAVAIGGSVQRAEDARVDGQITSVSAPGLTSLRDLRWLPDFHRWQGFVAPFGPWFWWWGQFTGLLSSLALGAIILALLPTNVEHMVGALPDNWGRFALIGFLGYLVAVPLIAMVAITIIGIPLALLLVLALVAARFLAYTVVSLFVGRRLLERLITHAVNPFAELLVGLVVLFVIRFVPLVGWLVGLVVAIIGLGAVLDTRFGSGQPWLLPRRSS